MKILKILLTVVLIIGFIMPGCNDDLECNRGMISKYFDMSVFKLVWVSS
ncbi:MAG: hypothetical protein ACJAUH_002434 [Saprospiraceae bacterium]|jgi:hypothetical protein